MSVERYAPLPVPAEYDQAYFEQELRNIQMALLASREVETYNVEPDKLYDGLLVIADGTNWNPGSGQGAYVYYNSTWNFLG